jgi:hypothetical protein
VVSLPNSGATGVASKLKEYLGKNAPTPPLKVSELPTNYR